MRVLHVAAMPFPSPQGTQGLIAAMLRASADAGHDTHLICYPTGTGDVDARVHVHRVHSTVSRRSSPSDLRSGPTLLKCVFDVALARALPGLCGTIAPELVIAHHVEAALCCRLLPRGSWVYCAHTSLENELASYYPDVLGRAARALGGALDVASARGPSVRVAVSPLLAQLLASRHGDPVHTLPLPWPCPAPPSADERHAARAHFEFAHDAHVVAYVGNLDAYQGLPVLVDAMAQLCAREPRTRWLVATASRRRELDALCGRVAGLAERTLHVALTDESVRRRVHAAATVVAVPRAAAGGIPIKLLDALGRGLPVVATQSAVAGHDLRGVCSVVPDGDATAFSEALLRARHLDGSSGRRWLAATCAPALYVAALAGLQRASAAAF